MTTIQTRKLAAMPLEFGVDRRLRTGLHVTAVIVMSAFAVAAGARMYADEQAPARVLADLQRRNSTLRSDLARARTELELERATRAALELQVAELNERAGELEAKVNFFNTQGRPGKSR